MPLAAADMAKRFGLLEPFPLASLARKRVQPRSTPALPGDTRKPSDVGSRLLSPDFC